MLDTVTHKPITKLAELEKLEAKVRAGSKAFVDVGKNLIAIREGKGYQLRGFNTFEEYCNVTFGFDVRHGQRMISGARMVKQIEAALPDKPKAEITPANEAVARAFTPIATASNAPKLIERVADKLAKQGKTIATATAAEVEKVVETIQPKPDKANGAKKAKPDKPKPPKNMPVTSDICPHCQTAPQSYKRSDNKWQCGNCGGEVIINVIVAAPATCPDCGSAVVGDAEFCESCGRLL